MVLSLTTELEAINKILQMTGEAPVNSLIGQVGIAKQAQDALNNASREVQTEGWTFNTDYEKTLLRNTSDEIEVGVTTTRVYVDPALYPEYDVIIRNGKLYDRKTHLFTFTENLKVDITTILEWLELPEYARRYIMVRAGRQLQEAVVGSEDYAVINMRAELEARSHFLEEETTRDEHSMLRGNTNHTGHFSTYRPSRALAR
tara:strand:- start:103 stop:708 length:606 start_codon:yes stop_codon:yes gene_type:complete